MNQKNIEGIAIGERLLRYSEAAEILNISPFTLRHHVSKRKVPYVKIGNATRFIRSQLEQFILERSVSPKE
ncbi:MAG: helix-turn-helix domain-containing protein [Spirochaetia bacterium]|nr:helix-turn-helix domain-containing protein [Spirochaetia bacterium]